MSPTGGLGHQQKAEATQQIRGKVGLACMPIRPNIVLGTDPLLDLPDPQLPGLLVRHGFLGLGL